MGLDYGALETGEPAATGSKLSSVVEVGINAIRTTMPEGGNLVAQRGSNPPEHGSPFARGSRRTDNGRWVTVLLVLNYMIGSGILNTPQMFRDSGVAGCSLLYIIACEQR